MQAPGAYKLWSTTPTRARVLVVEDHEFVRKLISTMLTRRGYDVVAVADGPTAIEAAVGDCDLVLLDLGLPGMDGLEVCRRLRADPRTNALPIVILTGRDDPRDVRDGLLAGASDFLTKPFDEADLIALVKQFTRG